MNSETTMTGSQHYFRWGKLYKKQQSFASHGAKCSRKQTDVWIWNLGNSDRRISSRLYWILLDWRRLQEKYKRCKTDQEIFAEDLNFWCTFPNSIFSFRWPNELQCWAKWSISPCQSCINNVLTISTHNNEPTIRVVLQALQKAYTN